MTNKEYVAQLESTVQNLRRDISVLKEKLSLYDELEKENAELKKKARTLEIIKEKDVDIYILNHCKTVDEYNSKIIHIIGEIRELNEEEFEILKRC